MQSSTKEKVLKAIEDFIYIKGYSPSYRELGKICGLKSTSSVYAHVQNLIKEGRIKAGTVKGQTRNITMTTKTGSLLKNRYKVLKNIHDKNPTAYNRGRLEEVEYLLSLDWKKQNIC